MIYKVIGTVILLLAGGYISAAMTRFERRRLRVLDGYISLIYYIKGQIDCYAMPVHILGGGVGNDVRAEFKWTAVDRGCKGVIDNQGYAVCVRRFCEFFKVEHGQRRVCHRFPEHRLRILLEGCVQFIFRTIGINEGKGNAHLLHRYGKQVVGTAVNRSGANHVIAAVGDVEDCKKVCRLTGRKQHCRAAPF